MNNSIGTLLTQVKAINKKYEGINKLTGENYNIFSILQFERKEVRLHTAFLGNLLDENGSHGMGTRFLELFIFALPDRDKIKEYQSKFLPVKESKIFIEKRLGARNDLDGEEAGGQVDIRILVNGINIIIENKIGAGDQEKQLLRYRNFRETSLLLYLTLNGDSPCDASIANNSEKMECDKDYFNISYKDHISNWLQFCKKEAVDQPMLREIIKQYIFLINKLTNQMSDQKISTEIINEIISSRENILAANQIIDSEIEIKSSILNEALFRIKELFKAENRHNLIIQNHVSLNGKDTGFSFHRQCDQYRWSYYLADDKFLNMRVGFYPMTEDESFIIPDRNKIETAKIITNVYESNVLGYQNWLWIADSLEYETNWQDFIWEFPSKVHKYVNDVYDVIGSTELLKDNTLHTSPSLS